MLLIKCVLNLTCMQWCDLIDLQMQNITDYTEIPAMIDERLGGTYTAEGVEEVITLTLICLDVSSEKRPAMSYVVTELERILDKEVSLTTVMGEGTPTVTLGSQLFKASK